MIDVFTDTWVAVRKHCESAITSDFNALAERGLSHESTEYFRGRIALARELLGLPERQTQDDQPE